METKQKIATIYCRFDEEYDKEIVAIYTSVDINKEANIIRAWRLNRKILKIEEIEATRVKYKAADQNSFFWNE